MGNPDLPTPDPIVQALQHSAQNPQNHGYPNYYGIPSCGRGLAHHYSRRFNVCLDPDREVVPLIGSKEGLVHLTNVICTPATLCWSRPATRSIGSPPSWRMPRSTGALLERTATYPTWMPSRPGWPSAPGCSG